MDRLFTKEMMQRSVKGAMQATMARAMELRNKHQSQMAQIHARAEELQVDVRGRVNNVTTGLDPFTGNFTKDHVLHVLRRTCFFGVSKAKIDSATALGTLSSIVDAILQDPDPFPDAVRDYPDDPNDPGDPLSNGQSWVLEPDHTASRLASLGRILSGQIRNAASSPDLRVTEAMKFFLHNFFPTDSFGKVNNHRGSYKYMRMLQNYSVGNFRNFIYDLSIDTAMLIYLDGEFNTVRFGVQPNLNYARELCELYTLGKLDGIEVFTQTDIEEAARILTGWEHVVRNPDGSTTPMITIRGTHDSIYYPDGHDQGTKQFSAAFNNTTITGDSTNAGGPRELNELIDMLFAHTNTALNICKKLYQFFVTPVVSDFAKQTILPGMAQTLANNNFELKPVLRQLFLSQHFNDEGHRGAIITSPMQHYFGLVNTFNVTRNNLTPLDPNHTPNVTPWEYDFRENQRLTLLGVNYLIPPTVAGWHAYFEDPGLDKLWYTTDAAKERTNLVDAMVNNTLYVSGQVSSDIVTTGIPILEFFNNSISSVARTVPDQLITEIADQVWGLPITSDEIATFRGVLLGSLADSDWLNQVNSYDADRNNASNATAVKNRLQLVLTQMLKYSKANVF